MTDFKVGDRVRAVSGYGARCGVGVVVSAASFEGDFVYVRFEDHGFGNYGIYQAAKPGDLTPVLLEVGGDIPELDGYPPIADVDRAEIFRRQADRFAELARKASESVKAAVSSSDVSSAQEPSTFEQNVRRILADLGDMLVEKNKSYGNSALDPVRVFSKADRVEQLKVRVDDKISRIQRGGEYPGDDTVEDLMGYLVLMLVAGEGE